MKLSKGTILQSYTIIEAIGEGGMGEVYLAEETLLGRQVAIKRLNPLLTDDPQFSERFINEARIQAKLIHPNIVALHNFFIEDGVYYMVMEFAAGNTLKELITMTGPIPEIRTLNVFKQLISALAYAHSKQIIHRDIKPSNIMIDAYDNVKVMDFGIARLMSDKHLTRTGAKLGTLYYMSPEQVLAEKDIDHRTDIYSAGVVLYEMLTGKLPYKADTDSDFVVMKEITESRTPDPRDVYPHISEPLVQLVHELTAKDKKHRPDTSKITTKLEQQQMKPVIPTVAEAEPIDHQICILPDQEVPPAANIIQQIQSEKSYDPEPDSEIIRKRGEYLFWVVLIGLLFLVIPILLQICNHNEKNDAYEEVAPVEEVAPSHIVGDNSMIRVEGGSFMMGSNYGDANEQPIHKVTISSFYISKYEITQKEWRVVMDNNPSYFKGDILPVEQINWYNAVDYCNKRSLKEGLTPCYSGSGENITCDWTANGYRLPTEAEWEYAARGGNKSKGYKYSGSNDVNNVAWYDGNSDSKAHEVGSKTPNELGIYDMSGNEYEWCWDWYSSSNYSSSSSNNPTGAISGSSRVLRGGGWNLSATYCRVANRLYDNPPDCSYSFVGFRLCRSYL